MYKIITNINVILTYIYYYPKLLKLIIININNKKYILNILKFNISYYIIRNKINYILNKKKGLLAIIKIMPNLYYKYLLKLIKNNNNKLLLLILDEINDHYNLGACLRCADATGVHAVIIKYNNSIILNNTIENISSGASITVPIIYINNINRIILLLKKYNIWIIGATIKAQKKLFNYKFNNSIALIIGNAHKGIKKNILYNCDELISINMYGFLNSLNLSVATGIILYEIIRQRKYI